MPAVLVLVGGGIMFDPSPDKVNHYGLMVAWVVIGSAFALLKNRRKARAFQDELNALATLERTKN